MKPTLIALCILLLCAITASSGCTLQHQAVVSAPPSDEAAIEHVTAAFLRDTATVTLTTPQGRIIRTSRARQYYF